METIDPTVATWWYFTFGFGQTHQGKYARIYGSFQTAREEMIARFGLEFCGQYASADEAGVERWGYQELDLANYPEVNAERAELLSIPAPDETAGEALPKAISDELEELKKARENILALTPVVRQLESIQPQFKDLHWWPKLVNYHDEHITLYCYPQDYHRIVDLMRALRALGYKGKGRVDDGGVFHAEMGNVYIYAQFPTESKNCRRVQVGTKEVPVYEIQCDGESLEKQIASPTTTTPGVHS